jgi:hypothetical protein
MNFKKHTLLILALSLIISKTKSQLATSCPNIEGSGNPVDIFHNYFQQIITLNDPMTKDTRVHLIYYRETIVEEIKKKESASRSSIETSVVTGIYHHFVFRVKYQFRTKASYIGIVSYIPHNELDSKKYTHFIVRYIDSTRMDDVISLLGIYDLYKQEFSEVINCPQLKKRALKYLLDSKIPTKCRTNEEVGCVHSQDLTDIFNANFEFIKNSLKNFLFGVEVSELILNKTILNSYKKSFQKYDFVTKAISELEGMINDDNEIIQDELKVTSDLRPKPTCEDILEMQDLCKKEKQKGIECLSEDDAKSLINYMMIHYMVDSRRVLDTKVIDGKGFIKG